ncbi:hypothetical protein J6590_047457 [Homalodisca vitripennis]|nr:hypothetical protein J6590_047457 [Homalodisca vitripennis]
MSTDEKYWRNCRSHSACCCGMGDLTNFRTKKLKDTINTELHSGLQETTTTITRYVFLDKVYRTDSGLVVMRPIATYLSAFKRWRVYSENRDTGIAHAKAPERSVRAGTLAADDIERPD